MPPPRVTAPLVIAHRGVPALRLEHTRPSYELAIAQGADFIEPDVVATRDGVLVVRHENDISGTTDVADHPEFADRHTTKVIDGEEVTGWFTEDFTLDELMSLTARERLPKLRPQNLHLAEPILTFAEVIDIARGAERPVGIYVETKHPTHFASVGIDLDDLLLTELAGHGLNEPGSGVVIQSFETNLARLRPRTPAFLVQLIEREGGPADLVASGDPRTYDDLCTPEGLAFVGSYADGIGPHKSRVIGLDESGGLAEPTSLVNDAHALGLQVHIWTMRDENHFLPPALRRGEDVAAAGDVEAEYLAYFRAGVDGVFTDLTESAVRARSVWWATR